MQLWEILEAGQEHPNMAAAKKANAAGRATGTPSMLATGGAGMDVDVMRPGMPMGSTTVLAPAGA